MCKEETKIPANGRGKASCERVKGIDSGIAYAWMGAVRGGKT